MSLLKVNEVQNYNGSSLTLTASTVSTSAQLNTGGNISVTGSINVSDDSTTRSNLGLGSIATQDSNNVTITGGNISNATINSSVTINAGSNVSGIGQLIGTSYQETAQTAGNQVTLESNKSYHVIHHSYHSSLVATFIEYTELSTDSSGNVTITSRIDLNINDIVLESTGANLVRIKAPSLSAFIENVAHIFEQGSTYDNA